MRNLNELWDWCGADGDKLFLFRYKFGNACLLEISIALFRCKLLKPLMESIMENMHNFNVPLSLITNLRLIVKITITQLQCWKESNLKQIVKMIYVKKVIKLIVKNSLN